MKPSPPVHIVVAMTRLGLIGAGGKIPWRLPDDLKLFRALTLGGTVIMGRRTFASIGRPLDGRYNIVLSSTLAGIEGVEIFSSFDRGLERARSLGQDIFCIGGHDIYRDALPHATWLHVSWVRGDYAGDTWFPEFDRESWQEVARKDFPGFTHITYRRRDE